MYVITGANGQLGRATVHRLLDLLPATRIGVTCREPAQAADLAALGIRVRFGDFEDPRSLVEGFEGAKRVLIVSSNARSRGGDPIAQHRTAIDACGRVGVDRVLYTSHLAVSDRSAFRPMHDHHATEALLADSGLRWTALRNGFYASSALGFLGNAFSTGVLEAPADGPVTWTTHADLAEVAARMLLSDDVPNGPTAPLVADQALDLADLAGLIASITGRPCERTVVSADTVRERLKARGLPPAVATSVLGFYEAARAGEFAASDPTLTTWLGRPPTPVRAVLEAHAATLA